MIHRNSTTKTFAIFIAISFFTFSTSLAQKKIEIMFEKDEATRSYTFYSINNSFATHSIELKFTLLDNLEPSQKSELEWQVPHGKTELLTLTPIDKEASTDFKYKKKSRKGCGEVNVKKDTRYRLPVHADKITQAIEYKDDAADNKSQPLDWYAIGADVSMGAEITASKGGIVTEIVEIKEASINEESGESIRKYLEIEHNDCTFGKYEVQFKSAFYVEVGDNVEAEQPIGIIQSKSDPLYNDLVFSVHYITYEEIVRNGELVGRSYYKAYLPIDFKSKE